MFDEIGQVLAAGDQDPPLDPRVADLMHGLIYSLETMRTNEMMIK